MNNEKTFWLPEQASTFTQSMDSVFYVYTYLALFILVAIVAVIVYFGFKYSRKSPDQKAKSQITHNLKLEIVWTVIPGIIFFAFFAWGLVGFMDMSVAPSNAIRIDAVAQKWVWKFNYSNGVSTDTLRVPINRPVKMVMKSRDVLHSFFIPAFRVKKDVIPNQYTTLWFNATKKGAFNLFCTEFCGTGHSRMLTKVLVMEAVEYEEWLAEEKSASSSATPLEVGEKIYNQNCKACHSIDGIRLVGPALNGLFGKEEEMTDGRKVKVDKNYILKSLEDPNADIVKGYQGIMTSFKGTFSVEEVDAISEYLKSLK